LRIGTNCGAIVFCALAAQNKSQTQKGIKN
jgi:hypothetical protein